MRIKSPYSLGPEKVNFKYVEARKETHHLIVVFTSIRAKMDWLDFDHDKPLLQFNRAHILWIYDDFDSQYSYYMCRHKNFSIEVAVTALIKAVMKDLDLSVNECTVVGMSKGGSAALRIGIGCNITNIIALAPQIAIGSYLANRKRVPIIEHLAGGSSTTEITWLDRLVPEAVLSDESTQRNVYLITSPYDPHCLDYLPEILPKLREYSNFNLISTAADLCRNHTQTIHYNIPFIVSLLGIISEGLTPIFGESSNGPGLNGKGHRDNHEMLSTRFGGQLIDGVSAKLNNAAHLMDKEILLSEKRTLCSNLESSAAGMRETINSQTDELNAKIDNQLQLEHRLSALSSSILGRTQIFVWRMYKRLRKSN